MISCDERGIGVCRYHQNVEFEFSACGSGERLVGRQNCDLEGVGMDLICHSCRLQRDNMCPQTNEANACATTEN